MNQKRGKRRKAAEPISPPADSMEFSAAHHAALKAMNMQMLIVLVNRLGGKVSVPVKEIDDTGQWLLGMHLESKEITGDRKTDVQLSGVFHFETRKKQ